MITSLPPAFYFIATAFVLPFLPGKLKNIVSITIPLFVCYLISQLSSVSAYSVGFLGFELQMLRIDELSKAFGYIFCISISAAFLFGFYLKKAHEFMAALLYVGAALGVIFAGDLLSLYLYWEVMAIASAILIFLGKTKASLKAGYRYLLVHIMGGLFLLAGILLYYAQTGSFVFNTFTDLNIATYLILAGFLVNAAAIPFSSWLPDAYPESTVMGGVVLSAYTSKTAVYTILRGFPGLDILIWIGCAMAIYAIIYALLENDMRRILGFMSVNQVGFMLCAAGIGTKLAIAGAVAHAFCHIIYKGLLWMSAGAVIHQTGLRRCTELGGLYRYMPVTLMFAFVGAMAISSLPFTSGFTSKTIIIAAAEHAHLFWAWLVLEIASAGVFLHAGLKFPFFIFFNQKSKQSTKEAPLCMLIAMGLLAFLCIYIGCFPEKLYHILPYKQIVFDQIPSSFSAIYGKHFYHVVTQMQLLLFSAIVFFLFLPMLKHTRTITLDFDWIYRKGGKFAYWVLSSSLNGLNALTHKLVVKGLLQHVATFGKKAPAFTIWMLLSPLYYKDQSAKSRIFHKIESSKMAIAVSSVAFLLFFTILISKHIN